MSEGPQQEQEQSDRPEPRSLLEAFRRINTTPEEVNELCRLMRYEGGPQEYDQGDIVMVGYDNLYDLQAACLMAIRTVRELESYPMTLKDSGQES